jgi:hypothetical protein
LNTWFVFAGIEPQTEILDRLDRIQKQQQRAERMQRQTTDRLLWQQQENNLALLDCWSLGAGDALSEAEGFRDQLRDYIGGECCQLTGLSKQTGDHLPSDWYLYLRASHLYPLRAGGLKFAMLFGLGPEEMRSPKNGLLLCLGIERAYDRLQAAFLLTKSGELVFRVLDKSLRFECFLTYGLSPNKKRALQLTSNKESYCFASIDGNALQITTKSPPYRRILWAHARCALAHKAKCGWIALAEESLNFAMEKENMLRFRRLSEENPFQLQPVEEAASPNDSPYEEGSPYEEALSAASEAVNESKSPPPNSNSR